MIKCLKCKKEISPYPKASPMIFCKCRPTTSKDWRPVPQFEEFYLVSSDGTVVRVGTWRAVTPQVRRSGFLTVTVSKPGFKKNFMVHRLVADVFLGSSGRHVLHLDGDKKNNDLSNLSYTSPRRYRDNNYFLLENLLDVLDDVLEYDGFATNPFEDKPLMNRLQIAYANAATNRREKNDRD